MSFLKVFKITEWLHSLVLVLIFLIKNVFVNN